MTDHSSATMLEDQELLNSLPIWDLIALYTEIGSTELESDLEWAESESRLFRDRYEGRLADLNADEFGNTIAQYEAILERLYKAMSFAQLVFAGDMGNPKNGRFHQIIQERYNAISVDTLFFTLEINRLDDQTLDEKSSAPASARYKPWLRDIRVFRPHQLSDELERLFHEKTVTGSSAWVRLFDLTIAEMRFAVDGEELTLADTLNRFDSVDSNVRRSAAKAIGRGLGEKVSMFSLITNTLAKDKEIEDKWRDYPSPISYRNLANMVEEQVAA